MRSLFADGLGLSIAILAAAIPATALAGYRIVDQDGDTTLVSAGRYKNLPKEPGKPVYIFDVNRGRLLIAAPAARAYWEGTVEEFCKEMPKAMEQAVAQMTAKMQRQQKAERARLSPAERAKRDKEEAALKKWADDMNTPAGKAKMKKDMEELAKKMGVDPKDLEEKPEELAAGGATPAVKVERTGETATLAGLGARKWRVTVDGEPFEDHWLASDAAFLREFAWDRLVRVQERFDSCMKEPMRDKDASLMVEETKEYRQLQSQGFPLKVVSYSGGDPEGLPKEQVTAVERRDVADAEFAVPAGFKKTSLAGMSAAWTQGNAQNQK
jgi:hypothetical protein